MHSREFQQHSTDAERLSTFGNPAAAGSCLRKRVIFAQRRRQFARPLGLHIRNDHICTLFDKQPGGRFTNAWSMGKAAAVEAQHAAEGARPQARR